MGFDMAKRVEPWLTAVANLNISSTEYGGAIFLILAGLSLPR
jgi:hypothetical protein